MLRHCALALLTSLVVSTSACSKHKCELESDAEKEAFGTLAEMTQGASICLVSNGPEGKPEMVATHGDGATVDGVAGKYKTFLEGKQWQVETKPHSGTRANGKPYEGQVVKATAGGKTAMTLIYPLSEELIETVTIVE
jgi:hypothetical protein